MKFKYAVAAVVMLALVAGVSISARGQNQPQVDPRAEAVMKEVAKYYGGLKGVTVKARLDVDQTFQGQSMKTSRQYDVAFERPNKLLVEVKGDARGGTVVSDGENLTVYVQQLGKFMTKPAPAKLQQITERREVMAVGGEPLGILASLLADDPYKSILDNVSALKYVGEEKLGDREVHRIRMESERNATEALIAKGDQPLLLKLVADVSNIIDRAKAAGQEVKLDISMTYSDWKGGDVADDTFAFKAPAGATQAKSLFDEDSHPLTGRLAPDFKLEKLDGTTVDLAAEKGKNIVILDFWATWCPPCVKGLPILAEVARQYQGKGVVFYAVNEKEAKAQIEPFLKEKELDITVLLDKDGGVGESYAVRGIPQTVIIDKSGKVAKVHVGVSPSLKTEMQHDLDALLAGKKLED